jgi:hypothetical protein
MSRTLALVLGGILVVTGAVWGAQGLGWVGGSSPMNGVALWAVVGPLVAVAGLVLMVRGGRRHRDTTE